MVGRMKMMCWRCQAGCSRRGVLTAPHDVEPVVKYCKARFEILRSSDEICMSVSFNSVDACNSVVQSCGIVATGADGELLSYSWFQAPGGWKELTVFGTRESAVSAHAAARVAKKACIALVTRR